jgi:hypothetical protein
MLSLAVSDETRFVRVGMPRSFHPAISAELPNEIGKGRKKASVDTPLAIMHTSATREVPPTPGRHAAPAAFLLYQVYTP